jgi:hypothetical protein
MLEDPLGLDRRLRDAARSLASFRSALAAGRGEDHAFELTGRLVSLELVDELAGAQQDPLGEALLRWALRIREEHALADLEIAEAAAFRSEPHALDAPERGHFTLRELLGHALANTKGQRAAYLDVLIERAARAHDLRIRSLERRVEQRELIVDKLTRRLGAQVLGERALGELDLPGHAVLDAAHRWLSETQDAWEALDVDSLPRVLEVALGRDSRATWPARVSPRALAELLRAARWHEHVATDMDAALPAFGASSFLRGLWRFGAAVRTSLAQGRGPFVLSHDPYGLDRSVLGALFAGMPLGEAFARRELGVSPDAASDHRRILAQVILATTREAALRVLLRAPSLAGTKALEQSYPELTHRALGTELPPRALGVLFTPRPGDAQRFAGPLLAANLEAHLLESHDDDWYRNPRAVEELIETARTPAATLAGAEELTSGARRLLDLVKSSS